MDAHLLALDGGHEVEPEGPGVVEAVPGVGRAPHPHLDRAFYLDEPLLHRSPEGRTVGVLPAEPFVPRVRVGVEVDQGDGPVFLRQGPEYREGDRVVSSQHYGCHLGLQDRLESLLYHPVRVLDVSGVDG